MDLTALQVGFLYIEAGLYEVPNSGGRQVETEYCEMRSGGVQPYVLFALIGAAIWSEAALQLKFILSNLYSFNHGKVN